MSEAQASNNPGDPQAQTSAQMLALVARYSANLPSRTSSTSTGVPFTGHIVLLTGSTGCLGSSVLEALVALPSVRKIFALNRHSAFGRIVQDRQRRALIARGLDGSIAYSDRVVLLEGDVSSTHFGLSKEIIDEVWACV
jgi:hypothetical protein